MKQRPLTTQYISALRQAARAMIAHQQGRSFDSVDVLHPESKMYAAAETVGDRKVPFVPWDAQERLALEKDAVFFVAGPVIELAASVGHMLDEDNHPRGTVRKLLPLHNREYRERHLKERCMPDRDLEYVCRGLLPAVVERDEANLLRDQNCLLDDYLKLLWNRTLWHLTGLWRYEDEPDPRAARRFCKAALPLLIADHFKEAGSLDPEDVRVFIDRMMLQQFYNPDALCGDDCG